MFKKKSPINVEASKTQSQKIYGIQAKLESMIQNGGRSGLGREKENKLRGTDPSRYSGNPQRFNEKCYGIQQERTIINETLVAKERRGNNTTAVVRKAQQKKPASFQTQLKGLIKIIYQKQKQIEKLKQTIKSTSIRITQPGLNPNSQTQDLGLNLQDIKQTTKKIIELETKQEELHEVIDFLVKKQEEAAKQIKQLLVANKELEKGGIQVRHENQVLREEVRSFKQRLKNEGILRQEREIQITLKDQEILKLNSEIQKIVKQSREQQQQLTHKLQTLEQTLNQTIEKQKPNQQTHLIQNPRHSLTQDQLLQAFNSVKHEFSEQIEGLQYEINNLRIIEEQGKQMMREQEMMIEQIQEKLLKEREERVKAKEMWEREMIWEQVVRGNEQQKCMLQQKNKELTEQITLLTQQNSHITQQLTFSSAQCNSTPQYNCTIPTHSNLIHQHQLTQSTITQYKKLLEQLKKDMNQQQIIHHQQVTRLQAEIAQSERKVRVCEQEKEELEDKLAEVNRNMQQEREKWREEWETLVSKHREQVECVKSVKECRIKQVLEATQLSEEKVHTLQFKTLQLQSTLQQKSLQSQSLHQQLLSAHNHIQCLTQTITTLQSQNSQLNTLQSQNSQLKQQTQSLTSQVVHLKQKITILQQQITSYESLQQPKTAHLLSLPTINNLSCIDLIDSSFECKLQQLNTKRVALIEPNQDSVQDQYRVSQVEMNPQTVKEQQAQQNKHHEAQDIQLQQNSYLLYQENLLEQLERQCNQPTELFLQQDPNRTKLVELSEVRQSLKMTKEVNFQLFQQINRQEKIINQFKTVLRAFLQSNKVNSNTTNSLDKLEALLLFK